MSVFLISRYSISSKADCHLGGSGLFVGFVYSRHEDMVLVTPSARSNDLSVLGRIPSCFSASACNAPGVFEEPLAALATGCDSSAEAEEPSVPLAPPQEAPVMPVVQVR